MKNPFKVSFKMMDTPSNIKDLQSVLDYFYEFSAVGGLTEAINPGMRQDIGFEIQLTGSSEDSMEFTAYKAPAPLRKIKT